MERKDDKSFKRDIILLISSPVLYVSTSFLVNIGKEMSLPGFLRISSISWKFYRNLKFYIFSVLLRVFLFKRATCTDFEPGMCMIGRGVTRADYMLHTITFYTP